MKIEVGKTYARRDGKIAGPMEVRHESDAYTFRDPFHGCSYTPEGRFHKSIESERDLIRGENEDVVFENPPTVCTSPQRDVPEGFNSNQIGGLKFDDGKPPISLLSPDALIGVAKVLQFGAIKYAAHNWRKGIKYSRILDAIGRHYLAILKGEDIDSDSGLPHIDHLICECMFLSEFHHQNRTDLDDRHKHDTTKPT